MTALPGNVFDESTYDRSSTANVYQLAGRFAAVVHKSGVNPTLSGKPRAYEKATILKLPESAKPHLLTEATEWIEAVLLKTNLWRGLQIVPVHADYSPRNWIVGHPPTTLGVIDWERSRPGYWLEDSHRMLHDHWSKEPAYGDAFYSGYGHRPTASELRQLQLISLINAVGGLPWTLDHGDTDFAETKTAF